jgi:hypothetical protein
LVLGLALAALWAIGLGLDRSAAILWFDAVAAVLSFGVAALVDDSNPNPIRAFGPALLSVGTGALFIVGASTRQPVWATWLNLLFAIAYIGVAIVAVNPELAPSRVRRRGSARVR